jgi:hypothetical protein
VVMRVFRSVFTKGFNTLHLQLAGPRGGPIRMRSLDPRQSLPDSGVFLKVNTSRDDAFANDSAVWVVGAVPDQAVPDQDAKLVPASSENHGGRETTVRHRLGFHRRATRPIHAT